MVARLSLPMLAAAIACSAGAQQTTERTAAGQVTALAGECTTAADATGPWLPVLAGAALAAGQRIRCPQGAEMRLRLPGSGVEVPVLVRPGQEYVVPMGRLGATPSGDTRGGREASVAPHMLRPGGMGGAAMIVADSGLARCAAPLGTVAFADDPASTSSRQASERGLESPAALLRRYAVESNCFVVAEVRSLPNVLQQSSRAPAGPASGASTGAAGRLVAADFVIDPRVEFGSSGRALGALLGITGPSTGAVAGSVGGQARPRSTLVLTDMRSGVQVGAAEGRADAIDQAALQRWLASKPGSAGARYADSAEGAQAAAALAASFNQLVQQASSYQTQTVTGPPRGVAMPASAASAPAKPSSLDSVPANDPSRVRH
ncbi:MAG: hypothetical protein KF683_23115 [Rubrivivax sp.]|nr:hypothetical protein [Rubrivivax sp.]